MTDTIAGVPSIVMGIFAYTIIVLPQGHFSAWSGAVVLAFIMLPIVIRSTEEMLKLVPGSLREGSLALGAQEWRTSARVLLPAALSGIVTGLMLAIARAAGEAAPMLFTAFGNPFMSTSLDAPIATLPHTIFVYATSPYEDWKSKAWGTALVLIVLVLALNVIARSVVGWRTRRLGRSPLTSMESEMSIVATPEPPEGDRRGGLARPDPGRFADSGTPGRSEDQDPRSECVLRDVSRGARDQPGRGRTPRDSDHRSIGMRQVDVASLASTG